MIQLAGWLGGFLVIVGPGLVLATLLDTTPHYDRGVMLARSIGLGLSFWPVLFLWTNVAGIAWTQTGSRVVAGASVMAAIVLAFRHGRRLCWEQLMLPAFLVALTVITRLLHVRSLALPLWVDSVHHTMIVRLLLERGLIPHSYAPFIPNSVFSYHWGFHAVVAVLAWFFGLAGGIVVAQLLLAFGQLLNVLTFATMYAAGRVAFASRAAGLLAGTFACLVSYYPAYYVSWGRYTHLAGTLLLPPFAIALLRLGRRHSWRAVIEVAILAAGLVLIHVRIAVFAATLSVTMIVVLFRPSAARVAVRWALPALVALVVTSPWLWTLVHSSTVHRLMSPPAAERALWETPNQVPADLIWSPNNVPLMVFGSGGFVSLLTTPRIHLGWRLVAMAWWAALAFALYRQWNRGRSLRRVTRPVGLIALWVAMTVLTINTQWFGLPRLRTLPNSAAVITLYIPLSLLAAGLMVWFARTVAPVRSRAIVAALTVAAALTGAFSMRRIVNPVTVLAHETDVRALRWIHDHTPRDAVFAVGVQPWLSGAYMGIDGGYWIPVLADRRSLLPPGLYRWVVPAEDVRRIETPLAAWAAADADPLGALAAARAAGVTHAYFGPENHSRMRSVLAEAPGVRRLDCGEADVAIYEIGRPR